MASMSYIIVFNTHNGGCKCKVISVTQIACLHVMYKPMGKECRDMKRYSTELPETISRMSTPSCTITMSNALTKFDNPMSTYSFVAMTNRMGKIYFKKPTQRLYSLLAGMWFGYIERTAFPVTSAPRLHKAVSRFCVGPVSAHGNSNSD